MTYSDTLAIVLGLVGREVQVSVSDAASDAIAMVCSGALREGQNADGGGGELEDEAWTFILQGGGASFHLDSVAFNGADGDRDGVMVNQGSLQVVISAFPANS